jgi:integrase/recombinase XerD
VINIPLPPKLLSLLNSFKYHIMVEKGLADNSVESYLRDIRDFLLYCPLEIDQYSDREISSYLLTLRELQLEQSSLARKRVALKQFFRYLDKEEVRSAIDFDKVPTIRIGDHLPDFLSIEEMLNLLDNLPSETSLEYRNKAMLELLYATGTRISELLGSPCTI